MAPRDRDELIGRDDELRTLRAHWATASAGSGDCVVVVGESGMGKSALLDAFATHATGAAVVRVRGHESEAHLAYAAVIDLVAPFEQRTGEELGSAARAALDRALSSADGQTAALPVCRAVLGVVLGAAARGPLLVLVDDAQSLDPSSVDTLLYVARRLADEPVLVVFATRPDSVVAPEFARVELGALDAESCRTIARSRGIAEADLPSVCTFGGTSPLALTQVIDQFLRGNHLVEVDAAEHLFSSRLARLDGEESTALGVLAIGGHLHAAPLAQVFDHFAIASNAFDHAIEAGLVRRSDEPGGAVEFAHPTARLAVLERLADPERRALHLGVAEALASTDPTRALWHRAEAVVGRDAGLAAELDAAAVTLARRGARSVAASYHLRSSQLATSEREQHRSVLHAASRLFEAGRPTAARTVLQPVFPAIAEPDLRAEAALVLGGVGAFGTSTTDALTMLRGESARIETTDPHWAILLLSSAFTAATSSLDLVAMATIADDARRLSASTPVGLLIAEALGGMMALFRGEAGARARFDGIERVAEALGAGGVTEADYLAQVVALADLLSERWDAARATLERVLARARAEGREGVMVAAYAGASEVALRTGRWSEAYVWAHRSEEPFVEPEDRAFAQVSALALQARVEAHLGLGALVHEHATTVLEHSTRVNLQVHTCWVRQALGLHALAEGDMRAAARQLQSVRDVLDERGIEASGHLWWAADLLEVYVALDRLDDAAGLINRLEAEADRTGLVFPRAAAARGRALLAHGDAMELAITESITAFDALGAPFEAARSRLIHAELRARDDTGDPSMPREPALGTFERLGAQQWIRRASRGIDPTITRASTSGGDPEPRHRRVAFESLTPRELEAAMLAARGMTNREIADELFLAPKTVEHQLGRVYRKLAVRSRTELAALFVTSGG